MSQVNKPKTSDRFIQIDEEGYPCFEGVRVQDKEFGHQVLAGLEKDEFNRIVTRVDGEPILVEAFDQPLIAQQVEQKPGLEWEVLMPYEYRATFDLKSISVDEWDRFHGRTLSGIPFVCSRKAQAELFQLADSFDDESLCIEGETIPTPDWLQDNLSVNACQFWTGMYNDPSKPKPDWELEEPSPVLPQVLPQIKIPRSRIMILGMGSGNDAAYLADQGHLVTAVDLCPEAIEQAQEKYGQVKNLEILHQDLFELGPEHNEQYDLIFEHTCYCAITPSRRNELVSLWKRLLHDQGHLLGVFFAMDRRFGPPFGGSEWEVRERLRKHFDFLYWTRWHHSRGGRQGKEFVVYAKKKSMWEKTN